MPSLLQGPAFRNLPCWDNGKAVLAATVGHSLPRWFSWPCWPQVCHPGFALLLHQLCRTSPHAPSPCSLREAEGLYVLGWFGNDRPEAEGAAGEGMLTACCSQVAQSLRSTSFSRLLRCCVARAVVVSSYSRIGTHQAACARVHWMPYRKWVLNVVVISVL